jgi:hypothetical protein
MSSVDPKRKAAERLRAPEPSPDPLQRTLLTSLDAFWIEPTSARPLLSKADFAELLEKSGDSTVRCRAGFQIAVDVSATGWWVGSGIDLAQKNRGK